MDEGAAVAGLARTAEKLRAYAAERGLTVRPELQWPGQPLPENQRGPVRFASWSVSGRLPGGAPGRLRHQAIYGKTFGIEVAGQHTIMVCRIPESVGYVPMLSVRAEGLEPSLFYWAGDRRPRKDVGGFESVELDRQPRRLGRADGRNRRSEAEVWGQPTTSCGGASRGVSPSLRCRRRRSPSPRAER